MNKNVLWLSFVSLIASSFLVLFIVAIKEYGKVKKELLEVAEHYSSLRGKYEKLYFEKQESALKSNLESADTMYNRKKVEKSKSAQGIRKILFDFKLGMSKSEYNAVVRRYKKLGKMTLWDESIYCMHWFNSSNLTIQDNHFGQFSATQSFNIVFDRQPKFENNKLHVLSVLVEPLYDDSLIVNSSNITLLNNYISEKLGVQSSYRWSLPEYVIEISSEKQRSKFYDRYYTCFRLTLTSL